MVSPIFSYKKACRVIDSCISEQHLVAARRYTNLFFESYSSPTLKFKYNYKEMLTDEMVSKMYSRLLRKLFDKQLEFEN